MNMKDLYVSKESYKTESTHTQDTTTPAKRGPYNEKRPIEETDMYEKRPIKKTPRTLSAQQLLRMCVRVCV